MTFAAIRIVGTFGEREHRNRLYTIIPSHRLEGGVIVDIDVAVHDIQPGELAVLAMRRFSQGATEAFSQALENHADVKRAMFEYLNEAINGAQEAGNLEIDRPAVLKAYSRGDLVELDRKA